MAGPFDKFTVRAKRVMQLAQEEARGFNHNYIGTEHILLGLLRETESVGHRVLLNLGLTPEEVRNEVIRILSNPRETQQERTIRAIVRDELERAKKSDAA